MLPLKDPTSDMAVISRKGSELVKEVRAKKEAGKSRARFWEMAGGGCAPMLDEPTRQSVQNEVEFYDILHHPRRFEDARETLCEGCVKAV